MAKQAGRIVSDLMDEPHLAEHRISVRRIHALVEERGLDPQAAADSLGVGVAEVYRALTYYHDNPGEMHEVERRRAQRIEDSRAAGAVTGPEDI
ncbi:DUF433 domain-containing protein [Haloglomus litoreum]|uniref:DUF433 domain-containing protein n=1 Tax=Haloglomus litoreum TaxID=3034026 RepID=UPI0023E870C2|nr:DUF433 domain-containing protein [Haloglomus sp. DT116]